MAASATAGALVLAATTTAIAAPTVPSDGANTQRTVSHTQQHTVTKVLHLTPKETAQWRKATSSPQKRAAILAKVQAAFAGVATVGTGPIPTGASAPQAVRPDFTAGVTGDHFWIIASYADIASGAIGAGIGACGATGVATWLCVALGGLLGAMARGWGSGNSHGVWAAAYWTWPPHVTGGRW